LVDIQIFENGSRDDDLTEDMEVEANKWYAVEWDADGYDEDDDLDLNIIAKNIANEDIFDSEKIAVDVKEDDVSGSKSNITGDSIDPVLTDGLEEMTLYYDLEEKADVQITVHKGKNASGSTLIELFGISDQEGGPHTVVWNGMDDNGKKLSSGVYSYKIVSKAGSSEIEDGSFIVGDVGAIDGGGSLGGASSGSSSSGTVAPGIIIDDDVDDDAPLPIVESDNSEEIQSENIFAQLDSFSDVTSANQYSIAIGVLSNSGIVHGYPDGTFKPNNQVNRAEFLKMLLSLVYTDIPVGGQECGFPDVKEDDWFSSYVCFGKLEGLVQGHPDGRFKPYEPVNLVEALTLISRVYDWNIDVTDGGVWYQSVVLLAQERSLVPMFVNSFDQPLTRGAVSDLLARLIFESDGTLPAYLQMLR
ncbi:MAG: S-layer homology domain-containing protein, partial [bacterium]|nr:S-layer homology domain-containing protein [bacterium]